MIRPCDYYTGRNACNEDLVGTLHIYLSTNYRASLCTYNAFHLNTVSNYPKSCLLKAFNSTWLSSTGYRSKIIVLHRTFVLHNHFNSNHAMDQLSFIHINIYKNWITSRYLPFQSTTKYDWLDLQVSGHIHIYCSLQGSQVEQSLLEYNWWI